MPEWGALGLGRRGVTPPKADLGALLGRLGGLLSVPGVPSLGSRAMELDRMQRERLAGGAGGPPLPGSPEAELGLDVAGSIDTGGILAGKGAKTADLGKLAIAEQLEQAGNDAERIWRGTGWWRGPDREWRFEIPDREARMREDLLGREARKAAVVDPMTSDRALEMAFDAGVPQLGAVSGVRAARLGEIMEHPELEKAYPDLFQRQNSPLDLYYHTFSDLPNPQSLSGYYKSNKSDPNLNFPFMPETIGINVRQTRRPEAEKSTLLHELQHFIQNREGFAGGGHPSKFTVENDPVFGQKIDNYNILQEALKDKRIKKLGISEGDQRVKLKSRTKIKEKLHEIDRELAEAQRSRNPFESYKLLMGEAEARAVEARQNLTQAERARFYPPDYYDRDIYSLIQSPP